MMRGGVIGMGMRSLAVVVMVNMIIVMTTLDPRRGCDDVSVGMVAVAMLVHDE
jgi:hypothetical protein